MRRLWFKQIYVPEILSGKKVDTIRKSTYLSTGDLVEFSVGPRSAFCIAEVVNVEKVQLNTLEPERKAVIEKLYGKELKVLTRIQFKIHEVRDDRSAKTPSTREESPISHRRHDGALEKRNSRAGVSRSNLRSSA